MSITTANKEQSMPRPSTRKTPRKTTKKNSMKPQFKVNDQIVYPAHGVGTVIDVESQLIAGLEIELFVIVFDHEKMKLRVPLAKADDRGMRLLSNSDGIKKALSILQGRARIKRTMWSRRAQEYEQKINSGSINLVAEVVRDLYRSPEQPEQSYSERQLYEAAVDRMAREVAAVEQTNVQEAVARMQEWLAQKKVTANNSA